jgi:hypothetical protein
MRYHYTAGHSAFCINVTLTSYQKNGIRLRRRAIADTTIWRSTTADALPNLEEHGIFMMTTRAVQ